MCYKTRGTPKMPETVIHRDSIWVEAVESVKRRPCELGPRPNMHLVLVRTRNHKRAGEASCLREGHCRLARKVLPEQKPCEQSGPSVNCSREPVLARLPNPITPVAASSPKAQGTQEMSSVEKVFSHILPTACLLIGSVTLLISAIPMRGTDETTDPKALGSELASSELSGMWGGETGPCTSSGWCNLADCNVSPCYTCNASLMSYYCAGTNCYSCYAVSEPMGCGRIRENGTCGLGVCTGGTLTDSYCTRTTC